MGRKTNRTKNPARVAAAGRRAPVRNKNRRVREISPDELPWQPLQEADVPDSALGKLMKSEPGYVGIFINHLYQVTYKDVPMEFEGRTLVGVCLTIRRRDSKAIHDWRHLQRIKNQLCGEDREAMEIYPAESRLVDTCNNYHLWVLPKGCCIPYGWTEREVSDIEFGANKQRPFDEPPFDLNARGKESDLYRK